MKLYSAFALLAAVVGADETLKKHHKKHHHKKHHKHLSKEEPKKEEAKKEEPKKEEKAAKKTEKKEEKKAENPFDDGKSAEEGLVKKIKEINGELAKKEVNEAPIVSDTGRIDVNGPLPADFNQLFAQAVSKSTGCKPGDVKVTETNVVSKPKANVIVEVVFHAPAAIVHKVKQQAADPASALASGVMQPFLVAKDPIEDVSQPPSTNTGIDVDTEMPYGELEPFGREDTAHELTESSIKESDAMVDQMEKAEVAEEKRSVFRALTRLRGAAITSFDGVARSQTGNIDEYNKVHKWRKTHPLHHLAAEESDVSRWAFPDASD